MLVCIRSCIHVTSIIATEPSGITSVICPFGYSIKTKTMKYKNLNISFTVIKVLTRSPLVKKNKNRKKYNQT